MVFKDSFSFLQSSLEKLVKFNKYKEIDGVDVLIDNWQNNFIFTKQNPNVTNHDDLHFVTEKGIYPYDYMDLWDRFNETELPSKEHFHSKQKIDQMKIMKELSRYGIDLKFKK